MAPTSTVMFTAILVWMVGLLQTEMFAVGVFEMGGVQHVGDRISQVVRRLRRVVVAPTSQMSGQEGRRPEQVRPSGDCPVSVDGRQCRWHFWEAAPFFVDGGICVWHFDGKACWVQHPKSGTVQQVTY